MSGKGKGNTPVAARAPEPGAAGLDYAVLARKYRPRTFDELIGQEAMVRTLRNAFATGRIAQAYMLTGVRGVGKTTTARILARALNYTGRGGEKGPTVDMPDLGEHCAAIMESRHVDVLEMDAASHTGIDDIREIIESARYKPVSARYKVYIIDEVHMLSKAAFNGLLKTLEEPPPHVKFIFATTEVRKVPVTVLSRCQRFDLRRVEAAQLRAHFASIARQEGVGIEDAALALVARAAEGSVRDGLSILDQAIAHASGTVSADHVRAMLGLADRARVLDLLEVLLNGDAKAALEGLAALHADGAEPAQVLAELAEGVHMATRIAAAGIGAADPTLSEAEREKASALAARLDMPALARAWQMLLKGLAEVQGAPAPLAAAEMVLVRMAYAAELPPPGDLIRQFTGAPAGATGTQISASARADRPRGSPSGGSRASVAEAPAAAPAEAEWTALASFEDVVAIAGEKRDLKLAHALERQVRPVRFRPGHIEISVTGDAPRDLASTLGARLTEWTGQRWMVSVSDQGGGKTIAERERERAEAERAAREDEKRRLMEHPAVKAALEHFPGAVIEDVRPLDPDE
ncbi:MAG: DNA polymerase III subunit gamma/tau [Pseudomonadota bacterium]|nr:DNA polymerase III subunit gamma/tau [Pseudomonadota bacterium]